MGSQLYQSSDIEYNSKAHIKLFPWEDMSRPSEQNKAWMSQQEKCNYNCCLSFSKNNYFFLFLQQLWITELVMIQKAELTGQPST